jgi:hypothetical protein
MATNKKMKNYITQIKIAAVIAISLVLFSGKTFAQFSLNTGLNMSYDDNINSNYQYHSDQVSEIYLHSAYDFTSKKNNVQLFYDGSLNYYTKYTDRTNHEHILGLTYSGTFGKELNTNLDAGMDYTASFNRSIYSYLDYSNISAYANFRNYLSKRVQGRIGYNFNYINFKEYPDLNNKQHYLFGGLRWILPIRTSLIFQAGFGLKNYQSSVSAVSLRGMHMQSGSNTTGNVVTRVDVTGKVIQSLSDWTGIALSGGYNAVLQKNERYIVSRNLNGNTDIFEDRFSYEGSVINLGFTQQFPWSISASLDAGYSYKNFVDRPAYDLAGNIISNQRIDKEATFAFHLQKYFGIIGIALSYEYTNNNSNDVFYNCNNNVITLGLNAGI